LFVTVRLGTVCQRCMGTDKEQTCRHPVIARPAHLDPDAEEKLKVLYGEKNKGHMDREFRGISGDIDGAAFQKKDLDFLFSQESTVREGHPLVEVVYVAFDPNGSGGGSKNASNTAIVSFFYGAFGRIVVRWDAGRLVGFRGWLGINMAYRPIR
jgi:hypothetical protein